MAGAARQRTAGGAVSARRIWLKRAAALLGTGLLPLSHAAHPAPPGHTRVVSVGGDVTEIVCALGAEQRLVGVDSTSTHPASLNGLPVVGYMRALSAEGVLSLAPQVVLAASQAGPPVVLRQLADAGVKVVRVPAGYSFESLLAKLDVVAEALALQHAGEALAAELNARWQECTALVAQLRARRAQAPRVMYIMAHGNAVMVSGTQTGADAVIGLAGGRNALEAMEGYKPLSAEAVVAAAPDVIVVSREGLEMAGGVEGVLAMPGVAMTPAGRAGRFEAFDAVFLLGFGPRLPEAVSALATALGR